MQSHNIVVVTLSRTAESLRLETDHQQMAGIYRNLRNHNLYALGLRS